MRCWEETLKQQPLGGRRGLGAMMGTQHMTVVGKEVARMLCGTLSKLLSLSVPQFSFCKVGQVRI